MCALSLPLSASLSLFYPGAYFCDVCGDVSLGPNGTTCLCSLCVAAGPGSSLGPLWWDDLGQRCLVWAKTVPGTMLASKVLPKPCQLSVPRTGMGRRPARVGHFLDSSLVLEVAGLPCLLIISNTTKRVILILGSAFPAFSSLPTLLVHNCSAGMCRAGDCPRQLACPLSIPGHFVMVPFPPALTEILPALSSHCVTALLGTAFAHRKHFWQCP